MPGLGALSEDEMAVLAALDEALHTSDAHFWSETQGVPCALPAEHDRA